MKKFWLLSQILPTKTKVNHKTSFFTTNVQNQKTFKEAEKPEVVLTLF